jgi:hypothetical protein
MSLKSNEPPLELRTLNEHVAAAAFAAQPDVCAEAVNKPRVCSARVPPAQTDNIAQQKREHGMDGHLIRA